MIDWIDCKEKPAPYEQWIWVAVEQLKLIAIARRLRYGEEECFEISSKLEFRGQWQLPGRDSWFDECQFPTHWQHLPDPINKITIEITDMVRDEFEEWFSCFNEILKIDLEYQRDGDLYHDNETSSFWLCWKASREKAYIEMLNETRSRRNE